MTVPLMQHLLIFGVALAAGATVAVTVHRLALAPRGAGQALAAYHAPSVPAHAPEADVYAALGLVKPAYSSLVYIGVVAGAFALLLILGLPVVPGLGGAALAYILADEFLRGRIRKSRLAIEQELPTFISRLGGMLLVNPAPRAAVEEVTTTLLEGQPLRAWLEHVLKGWQMQGDSFLAKAHLQASRISPLLGLVMYQVHRLAETGGGGFIKAFATTADALSAILEARAVAGSKAAGARQAVLTMLGVMGLIMAMILSSPAIRTAYADPQIQLISAVALGVMAFGYIQLNGMIADALEA